MGNLPPITIEIQPPRPPDLDALTQAPGVELLIRATWRFEHSGLPYGMAIDVPLAAGEDAPKAVGRYVGILYDNAAQTWDALHDQHHLNRAPRPPGTDVPTACTDPAHLRWKPLTEAERAKARHHGALEDMSDRQIRAAFPMLDQLPDPPAGAS